MKSLRTDDIIGAMPRVRHMPKNLYRDHQSYPYRHSEEYSPIKDYDSYYKNLGGKWDHSYNENIYGNFPLSQYDPNPFVKDPNANRSRYYEQNDRSQDYRESQYQGIYDRQRESRMDFKNNLYDARVQEQNIKPKQALFVNYDQVRQFDNMSKDEKMYHERKSSRQFSSKIQQPTNKNSQTSHQQNPQKVDNQTNHTSNIKNNDIRSSIEIGQRSASSQHNKSSQSLRISQSKDKGEKNIFRGLGFNIITNSKYLYNVESRVPYVKREN